MAIVTYPLNNIDYSAEDAELFHCTRTSGVFASDEDFAATVNGADNTVAIGQGIAWIRNSRFSGKVVANKSTVSVDMGLADGTYSRIDAVVLQFDANKNQTSIISKQGVASSSPVVPQVVRTEALYELHLYHIRRRAGATSILASDITDLRPDKGYCGVMADEVTALGDSFVKKEAVGSPGGVASLDLTGKIPVKQVPDPSSIGAASIGAGEKLKVSQMPDMVVDESDSNWSILKTSPGDIVPLSSNEVTTTLSSGSTSSYRISNALAVVDCFLNIETSHTAQSCSVRVLNRWPNGSWSGRFVQPFGTLDELSGCVFGTITGDIITMQIMGDPGSVSGERRKLQIETNFIMRNTGV